MKRLSIVALGVILTLGSSASAQPEPADADAVAAARHREGTAHFAKSEFDAARLAFLQAYAAKPDPKLLWNLAISEHKSGYPADALRHFREFFASPVATDRERSSARPMIDEAKRKVAEVTLVAPSGSLITTDGSRVDDDVLYMTAGEHAFVARYGDRTETRTVKVAAGEALTVRFDELFEPTRAEPTPPVAADEPPTYAEPPPVIAERTTSPKWFVVGGLAAVGVTGLVLGGVFLDAENQAVDQARTLDPAARCARASTPECARARDLKDDWEVNKTMSAASFIGGAVFLAASVGVALFWPTTSSSSARLRLSPVVGLHNAGASATLSF